MCMVHIAFCSLQCEYGWCCCSKVQLHFRFGAIRNAHDFLWQYTKNCMKIVCSQRNYTVGTRLSAFFVVVIVGAVVNFSSMEIFTFGFSVLSDTTE